MNEAYVEIYNKKHINYDSKQELYTENQNS